MLQLLLVLDGVTILPKQLSGFHNHFFLLSQMNWFATVVRLDYFLTIRLYSGSNFLHLDSIENIQHLAAIL